MAIENQSTEDRTWVDNGHTYTELIKQEWDGNNQRFSAGTIRGHPTATVYLLTERAGVPATMLLLRPDELAAIAWCASGVLFSLNLTNVVEAEYGLSRNQQITQ
jgi:hypothetical protein